jgi:hypothetical protein
MKPRFKHEVPLDLLQPLPECAKDKPVQREPVKRPPYDELTVKQRYDRELWRRS